MMRARVPVAGKLGSLLAQPFASENY